MKRRLSAAFVVTVSVSALGCHKTQTNSSCEPPDCHANPPPQPEPTPTTHTNNPPATVDAGMPTDVPTISRNPPPVAFDAGSPRRIIGNPPPMRDAGL